MSFAKYLPLAGLLTLGACGRHVEPAAEKSAPSIRVTSGAVETRTYLSERILSGTVTARTTTAVSARISGHIRELRVHEGDIVSEGQVIAVIDSRDADAATRQAEAGRAEARAGLPESDAAISAAVAQRELARVTFRRMEELRASKSITEQEFDEARARLRLAESQVTMAEARKQQTRERIRQAEENLDRVRLQQTYSTVTAPYAGVVVERKAEPGTFASPGMPVVVMEKGGEYRLEVAVEESLLRGLRVGRKVMVELDSTSELSISEILPTLSAQSRTATIRINLSPRPGLRAGMSGRIRLGGEEREAMTVPAEAVRVNGQLRTVFVIANGRSRAAMVTVGETRDGRVEILSGLDGKDRIIVAPAATLTDGTPIEVAQ